MMRVLFQWWLGLSAVWAWFFIHWTDSYTAAFVPPLVALALGYLLWAALYNYFHP